MEVLSEKRCDPVSLLYNPHPRQPNDSQDNCCLACSDIYLRRVWFQVHLPKKDGDEEVALWLGLLKALREECNCEEIFYFFFKKKNTDPGACPNLTWKYLPLNMDFCF